MQTEAEAQKAPPTLVRVAELVRVADQIVRALYEAGVRAVFGVPGGAISAVYDALLDEPRIKVVTACHETSAVHAAAAYARATGTVGVVLTTSGPGATNAVTGLTSAYCDGLPVVLISGEVPRKNFGRGALQEGSPYHLNLVAMFRPITKMATVVTSAEGAVATVRKALSTANSGRKGPVFLSLPIDVQGMATNVPRMAVNVESRFQIDRALLNAAVQRLAVAERPMILAGSGARWGEGPQALRRLAERLLVPVATTPKAKGVFPETHPLSLGVFGYGGHPSATAYLEKGVDVLLAVGTSFGDIGTNNWSPALGSSGALIQIDVDSAQIGKNYPVDLGIVGNAAEILEAMAALAPPYPPDRAAVGRRFDKPAEAVGEEGAPIKPQRAIWELQQVLPSSTAYACDIGEHLMFALHYLTIDEPDAFYLSSGLAAMGSSLGSAVGVKIAQPDRPVVAICGDGTISMSATDVATASQLGLNVIFAVMNDGRYGMVEEGHKAIYGRTHAFPIALDLPDLAKAMGARAEVIERPGQILALGARGLLGRPGPVLLDIRIDREEKMAKRSRFDSIKHFVAGKPVAQA